MGRVNSSVPSLTATLVQSEASAAPSRAARRGARSLPMAVAAKKSAAGFASPTNAAKART